jgi:hypothetical protein
MRSVTVLALLLASSTLGGCAAPSAATRLNDAAVRAEPRRISSGGTFPDARGTEPREG